MVETYIPQTPPNDPEQLKSFLLRQSQDVAQNLESIKDGRFIEKRHVAPDKPRDGMIVYADGTDWNPGDGEGFYQRVAGAWEKSTGGVLKSLFDANTILKADTDNTPVALTVSEQTLVGRITGGSITGLTAAQVRTLLTLTDAGVKTAYEANANTNAFTDSEQSKLGLLAHKNFIINGGFNVAQRGTTFDATTTPANNDNTYLLDRWVLLSDGNDIVDVTQQAGIFTGARNAIRLDVETIQKKFGILTILEQKDAEPLIGDVASLSFVAKVSDITKLDNIKAAVLAWDGAADTVTSDVISTWNAADTTPTFAANWTAENTPANLSVLATEATYKIENISIDTASANNISVFIWSDAVADNDTLGTLLEITNVKLERGSVSTDFADRPHGAALALCQRYYTTLDNTSTYPVGNDINTRRGFFKLPVTMRVAPTLVITYDIGTGASFAVGKDGGYQNVAHSQAAGFSLTADAEL